MSSPTLDDLVREVRGTAAQIPDTKVLVDTVAEHIRRLLAGQFFLDDQTTRAQRGVLTSRVLHKEAGFIIVACAWAPQQSTAIHDHRAWGVIAGVTNRLLVTQYRRLDDSDTPGFADVSEVSRILVSETSYAQLRPPDETIHKIENPFRDPAVSLHVFGDTEPWRSMFDPPAKRVTKFEKADGTAGI